MESLEAIVAARRGREQLMAVDEVRRGGGASAVKMSLWWSSFAASVGAGRLCFVGREILERAISCNVAADLSLK